MASIEEKVQNLIEKDIQDLGYDLYDVEYVKEGKEFYLRIYIQNETGISLEDCEVVNNAITDKLDEADYIKDPYYLEVSSCGLEQVLKKDKHFKQAIGKLVEAKLYKPLDGSKQYSGELKSFSEDYIEIACQSGTKWIPRKDISQIKTLYQWE